MLHYHGTPISPRSVLLELGGCCFCVPFSDGRDVEVAHEIGQSVMLDNGAFSAWKRGYVTDWDRYYDWAEPWLDYPTTWAVIPDVIDGDEQANDRLLVKWFQRRLPKGAPVWHMHESLDRLRRLCHGYERVCIGSSGQYATVGDDRWHRRMHDAMDAVCGNGPVPVWLHMLRGSALAGSDYPLASVDSTNVARNHAGSHRMRRRSARQMAQEIDARQCPARWTGRLTQLSMEAA